MAFVIAEPCVDVFDKACIDECPVDCIYQGERMVFINPDECVDCAACEPACPVDAIYPLEELPDDWQSYASVNAEFFDRIGAPGGAKNVAPQPDPPAIQAMRPALPAE